MVSNRRTVWETSRDVGIVPQDRLINVGDPFNRRDSCAAAITAIFNQLVGAQQERFRYREAERLGGFNIDD